MKPLNIRKLTCLAVLCGIGGGVSAQESPWFVRVGAAAIQYQSDADITVGGGPVPGAALNLSDSTTLAAEIGYWLTPSVALRATVGIPPSTRIEGRGTVAGLGQLGEIKFAPVMFTGTYSFDLGTIKPYIGGGIAYIHILEKKDGAVAGLGVESRFGGVLQAGVDIPIDKSWGLFVDFRKLYWKTKATGTVPAFGGAPAQVDLNPSPSVVMIGISKRF